MAFVEPPKGRAKIFDMGREVRVEIPLRPKGMTGWLYWLIVVAFLVAWVPIGMVVVWEGLVASPDRPPLPLMLAWTVLWVIFSIFLGGWCWQMLTGREEILMTAQELSIRRRPFGRQLSYRLSEVKNLRVLEDVFAAASDWLRFWWMWLPYQGVLAFDYGAATVRFGINIDPAEARQIVELLKNRFGQYMKEA